MCCEFRITGLIKFFLNTQRVTQQSVIYFSITSYNISLLIFDGREMLQEVTRQG